MPTERRCEKCGTVLTHFGAEALCPNCMLHEAIGLDADLTAQPPGAALGTTSSAEALANRRSPKVNPKVRYFGNYELLEEIAHGGMGVVYKARQASLNRIVALKMILAGPFARKEFIQRFRAEAEAAAKLQHPNIVAIHEVGEHEGHHYFSMDYVEGQNLADLVRDKPLLAQSAAAIIKTIAEAIHYAHQQGILHRDLKPSNVLIDQFDQPRVTDFGLAKRLPSKSEIRNPKSEIDLTLTGQVLGSPNYMPPEQASGNRGQVGPPSDVYSLGAILHHLLTGRAPFTAESVTETLQQVLHNEPVSLRLLNPSLSVDLETICLKCLQKESGRRYTTARELAEELGRWLRGEPILARPVGFADKTWRWCRRKPVVASLAASSTLLLLAVAIGAPIAILRTNRARTEADRARRDAEWSLYAAEMNLASQAVRGGSIEYARQLLMHHRSEPGAKDLRGFEWRYLWRATEQRELIRTFKGLPWNGHDYVRLTCIGGMLYNVNHSGVERRTWSMSDWSEIPSRFQFNGWFWLPYRETAMTVDSTNHSLTLFHLPYLEKGPTVPFRGIATRSAVSPDHRLLALGCENGDKHVVSLWDLKENTERAVLGEYSARVSFIDFSADGKVFAAAREDGAIDIWDAQTLKPLPGVRRRVPDETSVQFAPKGSRFVYFGFGSHDVGLWDPVAGGGPLTEYGLGHLSRFSPDGGKFAAFWSDTVWLFDAQSRQKVATLRGHQGDVLMVAFSPDGHLLATASNDRTVKLWNLEVDRELATLGGYDDSVYDVTFSTDGAQLFTISANGTAKVWDVPAVLGRNRLLTNSVPNWQLRMSADNRLIAARDVNATIHIWDSRTRSLIRSIETGPLPLDSRGMALEPEGRLLAWISGKNLGIFDFRSGQTNRIPIEGNKGNDAGICFSPDNREILFGNSTTNVTICDLATMRLRPFASCEREVYSIACSPVGTLVAFGHEGGAISLWDRQTGQKLLEENAHAELTAMVEFSRDGRWLASCGTMTINLWRVERNGLKHTKTMHGHAGNIPSIAFSPDGTRLVSSSSDSTLRIWDTAEGIELGVLYGHRGFASSVLFSTDGCRIFSTGEDGDIRVWEAPSLAEIDSLTKGAPFKPDGRDRTKLTKELSP